MQSSAPTELCSREPRSEDSEDLNRGGGGGIAGTALVALSWTLAGAALISFAVVGPYLSATSGKAANDGAPWSAESEHHRSLEAADAASAIVESSADILDFSGSSCGDILKEDPSVICAYARTCNGGDGLLIPSIFCTGDSTRPIAYGVFALLTPLLLLYLALLFRMLGSTAEDYFAPCPEMLSARLGLPPRFAGASLLALGNGAPDVSACINSVMSDPRSGYNLALGALTGGGMFVGTAVAGSAIRAAGGVPCRGALLRDVTTYALGIGLVAFTFNTGTIGQRSIATFFIFYAIYASSVLAADLYHRKVVVPRELIKEEIKALDRHAKMWEEGEDDGSEATTGVTSDQASSTLEGPDLDEDEDDDVVLPLKDKMIEMMSNYDPTMSVRSLGDPIVLHGPDGILADRGHHNFYHPHHMALHSRDEYSPLEQVGETELVLPMGADDIVDVEAGYDFPFGDAGAENIYELFEHFGDIWRDIFHETKNPLEKLLLTLELPFTVLRKLSISVPCEGYYCRPVVALSLALSPLWIGIYAMAEYGVNLFLYDGVPYVGLICIPSFAIGALVWRSADEREMAVSAAGPIALYGFVMAATWIDFIGDKLVSLLQFLGVVLHIPSPVMGLTVLAWGDSMGDLAANVALAKKGLANMAMTACFASPLFNMLIGLGIGFSTISKGNSGVAVSISPSAKTGFLFILCNLAMVPICGRLLNKGKIPEKYSYVMFGLYGCYIVTSILVQFVL